MFISTSDVLHNIIYSSYLTKIKLSANREKETMSLKAETTQRGARPMEPDDDVHHHQQRRQEAVALRPLGLTDADAFMAWASDDRVMRHLKRPLCATREQAVAQIRDTVLGHPWFRAICVGGRPAPVGQVSVWPYAEEGGHRANLGYALAHDHWGRGIATAAIKMVVGTVFGELPRLERLEAVTEVANVRSQRVLEKAGFRREGVLHRYIVDRSGGDAMDAVVYSYLATDRPLHLNTN